MHDNFRFSRRDLPHIELKGAAYFITWRLAQSQMPLSPDERTLVESILQHFHGDRYFLYGYVVMDDHVHLVMRPLGEYQLSKTLHSWKSYSANQLQRKHVRNGQVWQHENYDRVIRGQNDLREKLNYILTNPQRRWPECADYQWMGWQME